MMNEIISNMMLGLVFVFCAFVLLVSLWPDGFSGKRKNKKHRHTSQENNVPGTDDTAGK